MDLQNQPNTSRFVPRFIVSVIFHPRKTFSQLARLSPNTWLAPMMLLTILIIVNVIASGWVKQRVNMAGEISLPPDFEYYTAEQQAQYMQAAQATQGFAFVYVLPMIGSLAGIWLGWIIVGGMLHLATTLFGGRGSTAMSMNVVAWANLPFAIRELVRTIYVLVERRLIENPGISGFAPTGDTNWVMFLAAFLGLIDIYLIWHVILLIIGVKQTTDLTTRKATGSVLVTIGVVVLLQAGAEFLINKLGSLSITRPFFF
jgi:hypothetical protein